MIVGRATHAVLLWRLERGERTGVLDTLASSTSLTATLVSQFQLRSVSAIGLALMSVWALSPIGGQASIRQLTNGTRTQIRPTKFHYMVHNGFGNSFQHHDNAQPIEYLDTLFKSAVLTPAAARATPLDPWGNVKILRIELYESHAASDDEGWYDVGLGNASVYTFLIGIPIAGADSDAFIDNSTTIHTPYLNVKCSLIMSNDPRSGFAPRPGSARSRNYSGIAAEIWAENTRRKIHLSNMLPYHFIYLTTQKRDDFMLTCNVTKFYFESRLVCPQVSDCKIDKTRRSQLDHPSENWKMLDIHPFNIDIAFGSFITSFGGEKTSATLLDRYLSNPNLDVSDKSMHQVSGTTAANYSLRFMQLLNSYFTGMNSLYAITGGINDDTAYHWDNQTSFIPEVSTNDWRVVEYSNTDYPGIYNWTGNSKKARVWPAEGTESTITEILVANEPWVITLAMASIVLIAASLVSPVIYCFFIKGPEVMMNILSLATRNNVYIPLPDGGTFLEASDRARLFRGIKVRYGDVEGEANVGHLVNGVPSGTDGRAIGRIRKGRLYER